MHDTTGVQDIVINPGLQSLHIVLGWRVVKAHMDVACTHLQKGHADE